MENKGFVSSCHCISVVVVVEIGLKHLVSKRSIILEPLLNLALFLKNSE